MSRAIWIAIIFAAGAAGICFWSQSRHLDEPGLLMEQGPWLTVLTLLAIVGVRPGAQSLLLALTRPVRFRHAPLMLSGLTLVALLAIAGLALAAFPNSGDEYTYVLQAKTYASGHLWVAAPRSPEFFNLARFFAKDGIWISPYQPGWSLALAPFALVHWPLWTVQPFLGAVTVLVFFWTVRAVGDLPEAWLASLSLVISPFFLLNFASYFSHGIGALATLGFVAFGLRYLQTGRWWDAALAGALVGFVGFVRAFNAIFLLAPFVVTLLLTPGRRRGLIWLGLGGAPWLVALLGYYAAVSGNPLLPVPEWYARGDEPLGALDKRSSIETIRRIIRLYFWTSPIFVAAIVPSFVALAVRRRLTFLDWIAPLTLIGYAFYGGTGGNQYGPRYLFEAWPLALITVFRAAYPLSTSDRKSYWGPWIAAAFVVHLLFQASYIPPRLVREHRVIVERLDLYRDVKRAGLANAVVIVKGPSGTSRPMWPEDLARNDLDPYSRSVVYVRDLGVRNPELLRLFPGRRYFIYDKGTISPATLR